jgi:hypothetical protein
MIDDETMRARLSPVERGEANVAKLREYLEEIRRSGQSLPFNSDGAPNRTAIAAACGFRRNVLHTNNAAIRLLDEFLGKGTDYAADPQAEARASAQASQIWALEQRVMRLEQRLAAVMAERDELRAQLSKYRIIEEEVLKKGRRIIS